MMTVPCAQLHKWTGTVVTWRPQRWLLTVTKVTDIITILLLSCVIGVAAFGSIIKSSGFIILHHFIWQHRPLSDNGEGLQGGLHSFTRSDGSHSFAQFCLKGEWHRPDLYPWKTLQGIQHAVWTVNWWMQAVLIKGGFYLMRIVSLLHRLSKGSTGQHSLLIVKEENNELSLVHCETMMKPSSAFSLSRF